MNTTKVRITRRHDLMFVATSKAEGYVRKIGRYLEIKSWWERTPLEAERNFYFAGRRILTAPSYIMTRLSVKGGYVDVIVEDV